jgi:hypothetical protein
VSKDDEFHSVLSDRSSVYGSETDAKLPDGALASKEEPSKAGVALTADKPTSPELTTPKQENIPTTPLHS